MLGPGLCPRPHTRPPPSQFPRHKNLPSHPSLWECQTRRSVGKISQFYFVPILCIYLHITLYTGCPRKNALLFQILCKESSLQMQFSQICMYKILGFLGSNENENLWILKLPLCPKAAFKTRVISLLTSERFFWDTL